MDELLRRLELLEERCDRQERELQRLGARPGAHPLPFRVVNAEGGVVLEVAESLAGVHLRLSNGNGSFLVTLQGTQHGGDLVVHGAEGKIAAAAGAGARGGSLVVYAADGTASRWMNSTGLGANDAPQAIREED